MGEGKLFSLKTILICVCVCACVCVCVFVFVHAGVCVCVDKVLRKRCERLIIITRMPELKVKKMETVLP